MNTNLSLTQRFPKIKMSVVLILGLMFAITLGMKTANAQAVDITELIKLTPSDAAEGDLFGTTVSISEDSMIVGAPGNDSGFGSAYVFARSTEGAWVEQAKLTASDAKAGNKFGISVSISGDTAIIGAIGEDGFGSAFGTAYIFTSSEDGVWTEQVKLTGTNGGLDLFGHSVSISGDTAIVGELGSFDDDLGDGSGPSYVFSRSADGMWTEQAQLFGSDTDSPDQFSWSVSISGDTAIVGSINDIDQAGEEVGSAFVFTRSSGGAWAEQAKLIASDASDGAAFGSSVTIQGNTAIVAGDGKNYIFVRSANGAWTEQQKLIAPGGLGGRSAISGDLAIIGALESSHIFARSPEGGWIREARLAASDNEEGDRFGVAVAISGETAAVGAPNGDGACPSDPNCESGAVYIYDLSAFGPSAPEAISVKVAAGSDDAEEQITSKNTKTTSTDLELNTDPAKDEAGQLVGMRFVDIDIPRGATISNAYIQFHTDEINSAPTSVTIRGEATNRAQAFTNEAGNISSRPQTTASVAWNDISPWTEIGAAGPDQRTPNLKSVIQAIISRPGWIPGNALAIIVKGDAGGHRTAESYNGAPSKAPKLHIEFDPSTLTTPPTLTIIEPDDDDAFREGEPITLQATANNVEDGDLTSEIQWSSNLNGPLGTGGNLVVDDLLPGRHRITATVQDSEGLSTSRGSDIAVVENVVMITEDVKLIASDAAPGDRFGENVSISGDTAIISAIGDDDNGSAYIFTRSAEGVWEEESKLTADATSDDASGKFVRFGGSGKFGGSISITGNTAIVGASGDNSDFGSAYIFVRSADGVWVEQAKLTASDAKADNRFGRSVSISGETAIVGALGYEDEREVAFGTAYIFTRSADGTWTEQAKLMGANGGLDLFGLSVSISGDTAIVGELGSWDADLGDGSGPSYIFTRAANGAWTEQAQIIPNILEGGPGFFSESVSISGNTAIVGASEDNGVRDESGSAYIYFRSADGLWTEQAKLIAPDTNQKFGFGSTVSISGDNAVISGYTYTRSEDGVWVAQADLTTSDGVQTGGPVSISNDTVIVGARFDDTVCPSDPDCNSGAVYIYNLSGSEPGSPETISVKVAAGSDDAEEQISSGKTKMTSTDLEFTKDPAKDEAGQLVGMRFVGIDIPQGATITNAYIQFHTDEKRSAPTSVTISGEAIDNAATFTSANSNISSRPLTTASVAWDNIPPWTEIGAAGPDQRTPNLKPVIQDIISRPGWIAGNALTIIVDGDSDGHRTAESYNGVPSSAPELHIEFTDDGF